MLPFNSPIAPLPLSIEGLTIPRYGSLTVNECLSLQQLSGLLQDSEGFDSELGSALLSWHLQCVLATLLINSRVDKDWTLEKSQALKLESLAAIVQLFLEERDRPSRKPSKPSKQKDEPIDWADVYCRLRLLYPTESRLNQENFGDCPIELIERYLETAREVEIERLSNEAQAVANLGVWTAAANGAKNPQARWFNAFENVLFVKESVEKFPPEMAASFMQLHKKGKIPFWVEEFVELDVVKASAGTIATDE